MSERIEGYKHIPGYEGVYIVNEHGDVRSIIYDDSGRKLKEHLSSNGYLVVNLSKNCKSRHFSIHRIVAMTFIENPKNKPAVNHKDGNKSNNHYSNLEWVTNKENMAHARKMGLINLTGENHPLSKLSPQKIVAIRVLKGILSLKELADIFNVSLSLIGLIHKNKIWKQIEPVNNNERKWKHLKNAGIVGREG